MDERFTYLVEKFFDQSLTQTEKVEFEKYLDKQECAEYFEKAKKAEEIIETGYRNLLSKENESVIPDDESEEIEEIIRKYRGKESKETSEKVREMHREMLKGNRRARIIQYSSLAAVVAALALIFTFMQEPDPKSIFNNYYKDYIFLITRGESDTPGLYSKAIALYSIRNYDESKEICIYLKERNQKDPEVLFLYGLNLLALDSIPDALEQFNKLIGLQAEKKRLELAWAHWYAGLCHLRMEEPEAALEKLDALKMFTNTQFDMEKVDKLRGELLEMMGND